MTEFGYGFDPVDEAVALELREHVERGRGIIEEFFPMPFREDVRVLICPTRDAFNAAFPPEWGISETESWMVAAGVSDMLIILSPRVWAEENGGHDPSDVRHLSDLVAHELVHVFHGQHNPTGDFTGAEELGWFIEGLAVHVSGQLGGDRLAEPREAVELDLAPASLSDAWAGKYRYGVCGSLVEYIDAVLGREVLTEMLAMTDQHGLLALAGMTESELIGRWKDFVTG